MKRKYIVTALMLAVIMLIVFQLVANKKEINLKNTPVKEAKVLIPVKVTTVVEKNLDQNIVKTGTLAPFIEAKALAASGGTIREIRFEPGSLVIKNQTLAVLDDRLLLLDLQKSEVNVSKLKRDLQTYTELLAGKATVQEKVDEIRQNYDNALNLSSQIRQQLSDAIIRSPIDGVISSKLVEQGMFVSAGTQIANIVNLSKTKVLVNLTESEVYQIKTGQIVKITTDVLPGVIFSGKVSFISPKSDAGHSYRAEIIVNNSNGNPLRAGTFVYADFLRKNTLKALVIPREALTESIQNASVYVIQNNNSILKHIKTGIESNGWIEVTAGLEVGELVVVSGQINLKNGTKIQISK